MGTRGRKSAADLATVPGTGARRVQPPDHLTGRAREVFREIVEATDPKHFVSSDIPLLTSYAEAIALKEEAQKALDDEGGVVNGKKNAWYDILNKQVKVISTLAMRLRLTPHSRYDARAAARNTKHRIEPPPWD